MLVEYFKKNYEKLISTVIPIIITMLTNEFVNLSKITDAIIKNEPFLSKIGIWLIQAIIIMLISLIANYCFKRILINKKRKDVSSQKHHPLADCTKADKQNEIDGKIAFLDELKRKIEAKINSNNSINNITNNNAATTEQIKNYTNEKLYLIKQFLIVFENLTSTIESLTYFSQQCITKKDEHPTSLKFSYVEMNFYYSKIMDKLIVIDEIKKEFNGGYENEYQNNEVTYMNRIIDLINNGIEEIKSFFQ